MTAVKDQQQIKKKSGISPSSESKKSKLKKEITLML
jgi:hypothetical protein